MALYQRRESVGRTRFLLALSLSTLTAIAVAAPLAIQAVRADESTFAVGDPSTGQSANDPDDSLLGSPGDDRSINADGAGMGGIGSRPPAKGLGQTSKTETEAVEEPSSTPDDSVLTNPAEESEPVEAPVDPVEEPVEPPAEEPTTTVPAETTTSTTEAETSSTTEDPASTTTSTTEDPESTTSTTEADGTSSTSEGPPVSEQETTTSTTSTPAVP